MKTHLAFFLLSAGVIISLFGCEPVAESYTGAEAPSFSLTALDGEPISLDKFRGRPVVIHFGTSWCPFCRAEDSHLQALYEQYRDKGVAVLVVNVKETEDKASEWYQQASFTLPMILDRDGSVAAAFAPPDAQPDLPRDEVMIASNLVIDSDGIVRFFSLLDSKAFDAKLVDLKARLDEVLEEAGTPPDVTQASR
jgi:peroxiredoxin